MLRMSRKCMSCRNTRSSTSGDSDAHSPCCIAESRQVSVSAQCRIIDCTTWVQKKVGKKNGKTDDAAPHFGRHERWLRRHAHRLKVDSARLNHVHQRRRSDGLDRFNRKPRVWRRGSHEVVARVPPGRDALGGAR